MSQVREGTRRLEGPDPNGYMPWPWFQYFRKVGQLTGEIVLRDTYYLITPWGGRIYPQAPTYVDLPKPNKVRRRLLRRIF